MADEKTTTKQEKADESEALKQAKKDALSPDQKHANYLDDIERLHNEP